MDQLLNVRDEHDVRDVARILGEAVIERLHDWSAANVEGVFGADVRWRRSDGRQFDRFVKFDDMARMVTLISSTFDDERTPIESTGVLIGADLQARSFHFVEPGGESYHGSLSEAFPSGAVLELPGAYRASLTRLAKINYASGRETEKFELDSLSSTTDE